MPHPCRLLLTPWWLTTTNSLSWLSLHAQRHSNISMVNSQTLMIPKPIQRNSTSCAKAFVWGYFHHVGSFVLGITFALLITQQANCPATGHRHIMHFAQAFTTRCTAVEHWREQCLHHCPCTPHKPNVLHDAPGSSHFLRMASDAAWHAATVNLLSMSQYRTSARSALRLQLQTPSFPPTPRLQQCNPPACFSGCQPPTVSAEQPGCRMGGSGGQPSYLCRHHHQQH